jgi:phosphate transport system permease protein
MTSLPLFILTAARSGIPIQIQRGFGTAAVLLALVLVLFVLARVIARPPSTKPPLWRRLRRPWLRLRTAVRRAAGSVAHPAAAQAVVHPVLQPPAPDEEVP